MMLREGGYGGRGYGGAGNLVLDVSLMTGAGDVLGKRWLKESRPKGIYGESW